MIFGEGTRALCPRIVEDCLLVHGAVDVVRTEPERDLRHGHGQHHPVRLDVAEVIEQESCDRNRPQIVPHRRLPHRPPQLRMRRQERERDERLKAPRLVLQVAQAHHVRDALLERLDVPVEHRRIRLDAELMRRTRHGQPPIRRRLVRAELPAHAVGENLRTAARDRLQPRRAQAQDHLAHGEPRRMGKMRDLHAREALQVE